MTKEEFLQTGLLEQYCLGLTTEKENKVVEGMFKKHPELQNHGKGIHKCMEKYLHSKDDIPCRSRVGFSLWTKGAILFTFAGVLIFWLLSC